MAQNVMLYGGLVMNGILTSEQCVQLIQNYYRQGNDVINIALVNVSSTLNKFPELL